LLHGLQEHRGKVCSYLIRTGCDVNIVDILGQSALSLVAQLDTDLSTSICKKLIKAGYDISKDSDWLDESHVKSRVLRRPSFLKRVCGLLGIKSVKTVKRKYDREVIPTNIDNTREVIPTNIDNTREVIPTNIDNTTDSKILRVWN